MAAESNHKGGAPVGNANRQTHGLRAKWLTLGKIDKARGYVRRVVGGMRRELEQAILDNGGVLGPYQQARLNSACRHEAACMLRRDWLIRQGEELGIAERDRLLDGISTATERRDKAIADLGLDKPVDVLDGWPTLPGDAQEPVA